MILLKPVFIIAIVAVAMIGVMVPSVFAQIDVTVTPYKESHSSGESNSFAVEVSKVIPNTNLCTQIIQNDKIIATNGRVNLDHGNELRDHGLETGNYDVRVFYGECDLDNIAENSFGNGYATIMFNKELPNITKFMRDNYFPEKSDVGFKYQKDDLFTYGTRDCIGFYSSYSDTGSHGVCGINHAVKQTWKDAGSNSMTIIISHGEIKYFDTTEINYGNYESDGFTCYGEWINRNHHGQICYSDNILVSIDAYGPRFFNVDHDIRVEQVDIFLPVVLEKIKSNPMPSESKLSSMYSTQSVDTTTSLDDLLMTTALSIQNNECGEGTILKNNVCVVELTCGKGTTEKNGQCVVDEKEGGGCLIATATYGSEMATEVQQLRELRDNQLLNTESGTAFITAFNDIYYSFSPVISDYERENPLFKEAVKLAIAPMISSLSLMENAESESEVLEMGLSVIMLNIGMYLAVPAVVIVGIKRRF